MRHISRYLGDGVVTDCHEGDDEGGRVGPPLVVAPYQPSQASVVASIGIPLVFQHRLVCRTYSHNGGLIELFEAGCHDVG